MAQIVTDVQTEMLTEKSTHPELAPLTSTSSASIWRLWMYIVATIIVFFEQVMDLFKIDIQNIIDNNQYGTDQWWRSKMLAFQYGDLLVFLNNTFQYAVIDPTKQIIKYCSITSINGVVQVKVATSAGGFPAPLSGPQLAGAISYASQEQPSGIRFSIISLAADLLKFYGNIYYDASGDITIIQAAVEAAINNYLNINDPTDFNGTLFINKLIDAIQAVPGIVGNQVDVTLIAAQNSGGGYLPFTSSYRPESGYIKIDPSYPLSATLTYLPFIA